MTKKFDDLVAVSELDLSVSRGEYVFILGPSGCGKSVLLRLIAGLETTSAGSAYVQGILVSGIPTHKRNIPVVFQNFALFPHLSVRENIEYGLHIRRVSKSKRNEKSESILGVLKILDMAQNKPHQLSAGQRQRVGLGRALALEPIPRILLLDEPLGALDANLHINMQYELKSMQREMGITFLHALIKSARPLRFFQSRRPVLWPSFWLPIMYSPVEWLGKGMDLWLWRRSMAALGYL